MIDGGRPARGRRGSAPGRRDPLRPRRRPVARPRRGPAAGVLAVAGAALWLLLPAAAATAHPFGPPPTAWVTHEDDQVGVVWDAAYDDLLALGEHLALFREGTSDRFREAETQVAPSRSEEESLERSDELRDYVTERVAVHQGDVRCEPRLAVDELASHGVRTVHRCPQPVDRVRIEITMLHDVHPAYRTFALAERETPGPLAVFSVDQPAHEVDLTALDAGEAGGITRVEQAGIVGFLVLVGAGAAWGFRRLTGSPAAGSSDGGRETPDAKAPA
jgi:hypothetical protein